MKDIWQFKGIKLVLALLVSASAIQGVSVILQAKWLAEAVTHLFRSGKIEEVQREILLFTLAFFVRHLMQHVKQKLVYQYASKLSAELREQAITSLFQLGPRVAKQLGTGNAVTLLLEGVTQFKQYLLLFLPKLSNMIVIPAMVVLYIFIADRTSGIILMLALPLLIVFMILLGLAAQKKADKQWKSYRLLANHYVDSLRGLETLKYLGRSRTHVTSIEKVSERYRKTTMGTLKVAFLSSFAMDFFTMLSVATVAVFLGLRLVDGEMTLAPALTILILAPEYFLPIREIGSDYHATLNGREAGRRLLEIMQMPRLQKKGTELLTRWSETSELQLSHVTVQHDVDSKPSLQHVNIAVKGYKKIGIVGESGAGKSTLLELLSGFLAATEGSIIMNGQALHHLQREDWQTQLNYIPQHPYIFQDSICNNIRFYKPDATLVEVQQAAEKAGLSELLGELPNGLEEKIGEGGRTLSGGQAQRVALARAFLENRPVLLLDEPTAHLDIETEYDLKEKILPLFQNKLVFLATHRLHWMLEMDYIYFVQQGSIVEAGTHEELMKKRGAYYEMVQAQIGSVA